MDNVSVHRFHEEVCISVRVVVVSLRMGGGWCFVALCCGCVRSEGVVFGTVPASLPLSALCVDAGGWLRGPGVPPEPGDRTSSVP